jgi:phosphoribosylformimino-5-aminoimidazole carboxamide ribotide isomerase
MLIIPAIDLRGGRCVRLTQGQKTEAKVYDVDPLRAAKRFEMEGAPMLHVVDLDGSFADDPLSPNREVIRQIARRVEIPLQFGGGLRSIKDVKNVIGLGATRVVVGTLAVRSPETLERLVEIYGGKRIAVGIDASGGRVMTHGWERQEEVSALELAERVAAIGVERIVYTDVERDGMLTGPNIEQTVMIARLSGLKVTASGGISSLEDIRQLVRLSKYGVDSVIVGKALYEGRFTLKEALSINQKHYSTSEAALNTHQ